jgi:hypothetical protein
MQKAIAKVVLSRSIDLALIVLSQKVREWHRASFVALPVVNFCGFGKLQWQFNFSRRHQCAPHRFALLRSAQLSFVRPMLPRGHRVPTSCSHLRPSPASPTARRARARYSPKSLLYALEHLCRQNPAARPPLPSSAREQVRPALHATDNNLFLRRTITRVRVAPILDRVLRSRNR